MLAGCHYDAFIPAVEAAAIRVVFVRLEHGNYWSVTLKQGWKNERRNGEIISTE